jgi:hypothetical protein
MSTIVDTITTAEDTVLDYVKKGQEKVVEYLKQGVELVDQYLPEDRPELGFLASAPKPAEILDTQFAFAKKMLDNQQHFAKALLAAVNPVLPAELVTKKSVRKAPAAASAAA